MIDFFGTYSPYSLPAPEIVDRFLALRCIPTYMGQRDPFPHFGRTEAGNGVSPRRPAVSFSY